jgi:UDPglucose--hexose-1-phosphate uridylyltransferase
MLISLRGQQETPSKTTLPVYEPSCYLCPGNKRAQGDVNPKYDSTFVFVNDYSAVKEDQATYKTPDQDGGNYLSRSGCAILISIGLTNRLLRAEPVTGKCYVITFSPAHNLTLADMSPVDIVPILEAWTSLYTVHLSPKSPLVKVAPDTTLPPQGHKSLPAPNAQYRYMQIFENKGDAMGCSNPHPHCQVWTVTGMPEEPGIELEQMQKYRREQGGSHMLEDYATLEASKQERVVFENEAFLVVCPWWGTWPFETMILSKTHKRALVDFSQRDRELLAKAIAEVTRRYDNLFETHFPYSMIT